MHPQTLYQQQYGYQQQQPRGRPEQQQQQQQQFPPGLSPTRGGRSSQGHAYFPPAPPLQRGQVTPQFEGGHAHQLNNHGQINNNTNSPAGQTSPLAR